MAALRMVAGVAVKQSGLIPEIFRREDYALRLVLWEGDIMIKNESSFWLGITHVLVRQKTREEEHICQGGWMKGRKVAKLEIPVRHVTGNPGI